ncbi:coproporphyrinogen dehydrogenase HemZ [Sporolituus thermophilus]|uniref:Oxygen-independent coproporphyrinogen-3 oxidase n=1 Tax=Sporolituus thermophilus DSM 23256 TaxID=1123285 RepID=A0A1G7IE44_9FIRM|nr:coproporphyrinogen dehydrogenase HemZ [Sporolituus thermophilus]SDF10895.1 oxygen-independent coproporphyrinogen-3 oxidase [Sporolituus thermophilus DSM 23256]
MTIKRFMIAGCGQDVPVVNEIMQLFGLENGGIFPEKLSPGDGGFAADTIVVRSHIILVPRLAILTELFYWRKEGILACRVRRAEAEYADEDEAAAAKRLLKLNVLALMEKITGYRPSPWGILRGVRPTKIVHRLLDAGLSASEVLGRVTRAYAVAPDKALLVTNIAVRQRPFLLAPEQAAKLVSVYIGIPYCPSRCLYCSFPAHVLPGDRRAVEAFLHALTQDIEAAALLLGRYRCKVQTIYIGGGTPTSLADNDFSRLLGLVTAAFRSDATREFTVEAGRPDSITDAKIATMRAYGVTRVSVNPQSMQEKTLNHIGRKHSVRDIIDIFQKFRRAEIPVINMDIIAGLPGEDAGDMAATMEEIAALAPDNLTVHTLAIKRGSLLKANLVGQLLPDENETARMLEVTRQYVAQMGLKPYYLYRQKYMTGNFENVGYARPGTECLYNIQIMEERQTIVGIGPAAGTKAVWPGSWRLASVYNAKDVTTYIANINIYIEQRRQLLANLFADGRRNNELC